jgi:hypothetical protein
MACGTCGSDNVSRDAGMRVMEAWGFRYVSNIVWHKVRKDGGSDGRGVGFYFRNVTELLLFGTRGKNARTLAPGRSQVNMIQSRKREHSRKPDEQYQIIEDCSGAHASSCSAAASARAGPSGATRPTTTTSPPGTPTATTVRWKWRRSSQSSSGSACMAAICSALGGPSST